MFRIGPWKFTRSYSSRLIINTSRRELLRVGWGKQAVNVKKNFSWLQRAHSVIPTPRPLKLWSAGPLVLAKESYIAGKPLPASDITLQQTKRILEALAPLYQHTAKMRDDGVVVASNHGDLTHRNVLSGPHGLFFIDGDRSEFAPPEFDMWLLITDAEAHRGGGASHAEFINLLLTSAPEDEKFSAAVQKLYELVPAAADNRRKWASLWSHFLIRCYSHSLADCLRQGKSIDWLDGLR